jgi:glutaredoxin 3
VKGYLSQKGVAYSERDIASDESALTELEALGVMTTPVIVVDDQVVVGFDTGRLDELLG